MDNKDKRIRVLEEKNRRERKRALKLKQHISKAKQEILKADQLTNQLK